MRIISNLLCTCIIGFFLLFSIYAQELLKISLPEANAFLDVSFRYKDAFVDDIRTDEIEIKNRENAGIVCIQEINKYPMHISILLDASGSQYPHSAELHELYDKMIDAISPRSAALASLISFNHEISIVQDSTGDKALLRDGFSKVCFRGGTRLNDTISAVSKGLSNRKSSSKALIIISDGEDRDSTLGIEDAYLNAEENNVRIYMFARKIEQRTSIFAYPEIGEYKKHAKYIKRTGGSLFEYSDLESAKARIAELMDELNHLKRVGFFVDPSGKPVSDLRISVSRKGVKATYPSTLQYID